MDFAGVKLNSNFILFKKSLLAVFNMMTDFFTKNSADLLDDIFCFYGLMNPEGFLLDLKGIIFEETAIESELIIGQKFAETVFWQASPHISGVLQNAVEEAAKGNKSKLQLEFRVNAKKTIFVDLFLNPVSGSQNEVTEIKFYALDVTDREKEIHFYKKQSEQLLYAAENAEIGLWFWDLSEDRITGTPKFNEFYGIPPFDSLTSDSFFKILHPEDTPQVIENIRNSQVGDKEFNTEYRVVYSDGNIQWLAAFGKTFYDAEKNPIQMSGMVRKITDRKLADEELARVHERERKALDNAEEANRAKDYFIAFVSHELRSPLNSILGWAKILLTKEVNDETRRNALETIERSAKTQAKLIEDLVDSARVTSGKLRLDLCPMNLYEVVNNTFQSHLPAAQSRQINLIFESATENAGVYGDPMRLQQVFTNLLTNALKFTPNGGSILLNLQVRGKHAVVSIQDSGQGISPEFLPKIFQQFSQAESASRDRSGLGLGLAIVKTLVEKQGGTVKAESDGIGKGAIFTVSLPLFSQQSMGSSDSIHISESGGYPLKGLKIIVVEDDFDSREVLKLFLEQSGAIVKSAASAKEATSFLTKNNKFTADLIISDIGMPTEDGYSFIKKVRQLDNPLARQIPAVALSAFASAENKKKAFEAGFQKYHTKPFEPDLLIEEIKQLTKG